MTKALESPLWYIVKGLALLEALAGVGLTLQGGVAYKRLH